MELQTKSWNGFVQGTNTGKLNLTLTELGENPKGILRFHDDTTGPVIYELEGTSTDAGITFEGTTTTEKEGVEYGPITIVCQLTPEGNLRGTWSSPLGTGGNFVAYPFEEVSTGISTGEPPEQIFTKRIQLGFIQLYKEDIANIVEFIRKEFVGREVVVTCQSQDKPERTNYFRDFAKINDILKITYLKLYIWELEGKGINRSITIELRAFGANELTVQGMKESWVLGQAHMTAAFLRKYEDRPRNAFNRFLAPAQIIILLAFIVAISSMDALTDKFWLAIIAFGVLYGAPRIFSIFFPNAVIKIGDTKPGLIEISVRKGGSWIVLGILSIGGLLWSQFAEKIANGVHAFLTAVF